jgi:hypothetical protein
MEPTDAEQRPPDPYRWLSNFKNPIQVVALVVAMFFANVIGPIVKHQIEGKDQNWLQLAAVYGSIIIVLLVLLLIIQQYIDRLVTVLINHTEKVLERRRYWAERRRMERQQRDDADQLAQIARQPLETLVLAHLPYTETGSKTMAQILKAVGTAYEKNDVRMAVQRLNSDEKILQTRSKPPRFFKSKDA